MKEFDQIQSDQNITIELLKNKLEEMQIDQKYLLDENNEIRHSNEKLKEKKNN